MQNIYAQNQAQQEGRSLEQLAGGLGDIVMIDSIKEARTRGVLPSRELFVAFTEHWQFGLMVQLKRYMLSFGVEGLTLYLII